MTNKLQPALVGGVLLGSLSALPVIGVVNICCCLWAVVGGASATYLYVLRSPVRAEIADGIMLGALSGAIGGIIYFVIGVPLNLLFGNVTLRLMYELTGATELLQKANEQSALSQFVSALFGVVLIAIFSTIGGAIGVPLFEKRKSDPPNSGNPPPLSNYGNQTNQNPGARTNPYNG